MKKTNQRISLLKAMRRTIPMIFRIVPFWSITYITITLLNGIALGLSAPVNQRLYEALTNLALGYDVLRYVYIGAIMVTGIMLFQQFATAAHVFISNHVINYIIDIKLRQIFHLKMKTLPTQVFEDKTKLDDLEKSDMGKRGIIHMYQILINLIFLYGIYFVVMGIFLFNIQPILVLAILFTFAPVVFAQVVEARLQAKLEEESAPVRRQHSHYSECLTGLKSIKEIRLFGAFYFFKCLFMDTLKLLAQKEWKSQKKIQIIYLGLNTIKAAGWVGILILLFRGLIMGNITVGAFAAVYGSISMMFSMTEDLLNQIKHNITEWLGKIHNFINVLDIPTSATCNTKPDIKSKGIVATNITFAYPLSKKNAVDDVTLSICPGETIALVGENGSGKTTLVKLLCGLYKPDQGKVLVGGQDSSNSANSALFSKSSGVFQNFVPYLLTLEENVKISNYKSNKSPISSMEEADVNYKDKRTFPNALETMLSREFDGVDLSGGQWQRVATARGLYRPHDLIILDEPTAAIDPIEETRIYKRFAELTKNKTAIIVTHRLGSAKIADRIVVMDGGKIIEAGTHESLIGKRGKYFEMWKAQSESYV